MICGGITGITASTLTYPLDIIRTVLTVQVDKEMGIVECGRDIYRTGGVRGLYKGWLMSMLGITPYIGINMTVFDILKGRFLPSKDHKNFDMINLLMGAVSGGVAVTLTYPSDLTRRLL